MQRADFTPEAFYRSAELRRFEIEDATLALRTFGSGPALVLIHGFPVHGYTWRKLLPALSEKFTCHVVDLPGLGDSLWTSRTDMTFTAQARRLRRLCEALGLERCALVAQDTGATLARLVALADPERVARLALFNTEIPGHRPPWIPLYVHLAHLPGAAAGFAALMRSQRFLRSPLGMGEFYSDARLFDDPDSLGPYVEPLLRSRARMAGVLAYLRGAEWDVVDRFEQDHARIRAATLFLWGEDDRTFPVARAVPMSAQMRARTAFVRIANASLMPHEEQPAAVLHHLVPFLAGG
jgi:pimeloyl-ACP methyl ester carboxylesterase